MNKHTIYLQKYSEWPKFKIFSINVCFKKKKTSHRSDGDNYTYILEMISRAGIYLDLPLKGFAHNYTTS